MDRFKIGFKDFDRINYCVTHPLFQTMFSCNNLHQFPFSSPIKNLPIELLSYIFSLSVNLSSHPCLEEEEEEEHTPPTITTKSVQVPLVLSIIVCRLWREVALEIPRLWSSLCITVELVNLCNEPQLLDTSHITSYLALSRKYPLNILIDARDEKWNFEPECVPILFLPLLVLIQNICTFRSVSDHGEELYTPAFTSEHMNIVFTLLLPHLSRWKSLSILTDCWAPMYSALTAINPIITRFGAPLLESLSLMRCNELISFSPHFQPQQLKEPEFLNRGGQNSDCASDMMIPSLKYLSLRGVHVDWDSLGDSLSTSKTSLTCLELVSHSHDVQPSPYQVLKILSSSIGLRNLVLSASGPTSSAVQNDRAFLPHLRNLTIGYRTATEGLVALELIYAPYTKKLVLEDATYVCDPDDIDAAPLLSYIGTKQLVETHQNDLPFPLLDK
jgi:hypothetical protein